MQEKNKERYYPETCNQCGGNDTAYRQFFIKPDENCPMEYKSSAPPTKLMLTPKKACKAEVILYSPKAAINYEAPMAQKLVQLAGTVRH